MVNNRLQSIVKKTIMGLTACVLCMTQIIPAGFTFAQTESAAVQKAYNKQNEVRGVWISYFELEPMLKNKTEEAFRKSVSDMFTALSNDQMNTVYVQVRPFGDALYKSNIFPSSYMLTGVEGDKMPYDPLAIMIDIAHAKGLKLEAWINPYRVRINAIKAPISVSNPVNPWLSDGSNRAVKLSSGTFYNPSDERVRKLVVDGVKEIVDRYPIDGIHFDDYFYPTSDVKFDKTQYDAYLSGGGKLKLADFRREQINLMVKEVYKVCKIEGKNVRFGISPQGLVKTNYDSQYADVKKWVTEKGYIDYICPQIYYGFKNTKAPFRTVLKEWDTLTKESKVDVYIGLAAYKIGWEDKWSGGGKTEWVNDKEILKQMVVESRTINNYKGFAIFRYDSLWKPGKAYKAKVDLEREALRQLCLGNI